MTKATANEIEKIHALCREQGIRLTRTRSRVLQGLIKAEQPVSPYELAKIMAEDQSKKAVVASIYRVLSFFEQHQIVHKIQSVHKFQLCQHMDKCCHHQRAMFLICNECGSVTEHPASSDLFEAVDSQSKVSGFAARTDNIELTGICGICEGKAS